MRAGEIVGIAGVDGNGQSELVEAITGLRKPEAGRIVAAGEDVTDEGCRECLDAGVGHIPEDRQRRGLVLDFSLAENIALHDFRQEPDSKWGWLYPKRLVARARGLLKEFDVRGGGPQTLAGSLSGGNQQKVVIAREVSRDPKSSSPRSRPAASTSARSSSSTGASSPSVTRAEGSCSSRSSSRRSSRSPTASSSSTRARSSAEYPPEVSEEELGIAMTGGRKAETAA